MKLLEEFTSLSDAETLSERLREKGILTHVSSVHSKQLGALVTGAVKVGVWVVLNEQVHDAKALLKNRHHNVANPLTEKDMEALDSKAANQISRTANTVLNKLAIAVATMIMLVVAYSVLSNS
jgi:hypothetical protein